VAPAGKGGGTADSGNERREDASGDVATDTSTTSCDGHRDEEGGTPQTPCATYCTCMAASWLVDDVERRSCMSNCQAITSIASFSAARTISKRFVGCLRFTAHMRFGMGAGVPSGLFSVTPSV